MIEPTEKFVVQVGNCLDPLIPQLGHRNIYVMYKHTEAVSRIHVYTHNFKHMSDIAVDEAFVAGVWPNVRPLDLVATSIYTSVTAGTTELGDYQ